MGKRYPSSGKSLSTQPKERRCRLKTIKIVSLLALLVVLTPAVFSQSRDTGAITGKVTDDQSNPLAGATVILTSQALMSPRSLVTDAKGEFRFPALPPGVNDNIAFGASPNTGIGYTGAGGPLPDSSVEPGPRHLLCRAARQQPLPDGEAHGRPSGENLHPRPEVPFPRFALLRYGL